MGLDVNTADLGGSGYEGRWQRGLHDPDAPLVLAAQQDSAQFVALYDRYLERILAYARLRVADATVAEDVTSQIFLTALSHLNRFEVRNGGSFAAWLFRIAHNTVHDLYRELKPGSAAVGALSAQPDEAPGPEAIVLAQDRAVQLHGAIARLRPEQQHLLALRYGADLSHDEIAALLGKKPGTVRVSLHRVLGALRRRYSHDDR